MARPAVRSGGGAGGHFVAGAQCDFARLARTPDPRADRHGRGDRKRFGRPAGADDEIKNLRLYNPPDFGGTPFLDIPEIHVEYDRAALAPARIHITLLRFNLGEIDIVKNQAGQTNLFPSASAPEKIRRRHAGRSISKQPAGFHGHSAIFAFFARVSALTSARAS
jgi:hypothetical protein